MTKNYIDVFREKTQQTAQKVVMLKARNQKS